MSDLDKYQKIKRSVETLSKKLNQTEGALSQLMEVLKNDFKCEALEEARNKLKQMKQKRDKLQKSLDAELTPFMKLYESRLIRKQS